MGCAAQGEGGRRWLQGLECEELGARKDGAGYGNRTRLAGLGSQSITTMLTPQRGVSKGLQFIDIVTFSVEMDRIACYDGLVLFEPCCRLA